MLGEDRTIYVVDTNVLVDYPDIIPEPGELRFDPVNPTVDLSAAHIVIPTAVVRELSGFKKEKSERGKAARVVLKRIRAMFEGDIHNMRKIYNLADETSVKIGRQAFSLLPVHKAFKRSLPFCPSENDMDGQIILATLTVAFRLNELPIDGSAEMEKVMNLTTEGVVLLTNDNGLAGRARERGIKTSRYEYKYPDPYTGRRDAVVPKEILNEFFALRKIPRTMFEEALPEQAKLAANEFIIMTLADPSEYPKDFDPNNTPYFEHIGRYDALTDEIVALKYVSKFPIPPKNAGQAIYIEALMDPDFAAVICTGPAGSGKTFMATIYGYEACKDGQYIGVTVVPCENHGRLGALPGDLDEKMDPDVQPLKNALRNYFLREDPKFRKELEKMRKFGAAAREFNEDEDERRNGSLKGKLENRVELVWKNWFSSVPIENARGRDFSHELALYDEFQDQNISQADTLIKRIGREGKIVITGDIWQIHAPYLDTNNNGLVYASSMLYDNPLVAQVCFTEEEVVRHPLVAMIAKRQKEQARLPVANDPPPAR